MAGAGPGPIIFDDGGSLRIRRELYQGTGIMGDLLRVQRQAETPHSTDIAQGPFAHITGTTICGNGSVKTWIDRALVPGDHFTIRAANHQSVSGAIDVQRQCVITIKGAGGNPPIVESGLFDEMLRYHVLNAGPIRRIDGTSNGEEFHFEAAECKSLYTALVLNCQGVY